MGRGLFLLVLTTLLFVPHRASATARPDLLDPKQGCERWLGSAKGNDPTVRLNVRLCPAGDGVTGEVQWSSLRSGWNLRTVEGRWEDDGHTLKLRDVRIIEEKPNPGWRFCTIDRYELRRSGPNELRGSYFSAACRDQAAVQLERMADETDGGPATPETPSATSTASAVADVPIVPPATGSSGAPKKPPPPVSEEQGGCDACAVGRRASTPRSRWLWPLAVAALGSLHRRRGHRCRVQRRR